MIFTALQGDSITLLRVDLPVTVRVTADSPTLLRYTAARPQVITIDAYALDDALDPTLELYDTNGLRIAYADDRIDTDSGAVEVHARIDSVRLEAGEYIVAVDSFNGVSEGDVEVLLTHSDAATPAPTDDDTLTHSSLLRRGEILSYALTDYAGQSVTISVWDPRGTLDPVLTLVDADRQVIARNDDHQGGALILGLFGAQLDPFTVTDGLTVRVHEALGRRGTLMLRIEPMR